MPGAKLNLLSLDGGGVRGLSSLLILDRLMRMLNRANPPKPCEIFDMIAGTSTGGIIAILLGRLHLSVEEALHHYTDLMDRVFSQTHKYGGKINLKTRSIEVQSRFDTRQLETIIKDVIKQCEGNMNTIMLEDKPQCKTFVCVTDCQTNSSRLFPNYDRERGNSWSLQGVTIWEAARATSAASTFFDDIAIGAFNQRFRDGGTGSNNPVKILWGEAQSEFPNLADDLNCIISIGTGQSSAKEFQEDSLTGLLQTLADIATETEQSSRDFGNSLSQNIVERYFRLNIGGGLGDIGLEDSSKIAKIASITEQLFEDRHEFERTKRIHTLLKESMEDQTIYPQSLTIQYDRLSLRNEAHTPLASPVLAYNASLDNTKLQEEVLSSHELYRNLDPLVSLSSAAWPHTGIPVQQYQLMELLEKDLSSCRDHERKVKNGIQCLHSKEIKQAQSVLLSRQCNVKAWLASTRSSIRLLQAPASTHMYPPTSYIWSVLLEVLPTNPLRVTLSFSCSAASSEDRSPNLLCLLRGLLAQMLQIPSLNLAFTSNFEEPYDGNSTVDARRLIDGIISQCGDAEIFVLIEGLQKFRSSGECDEFRAFLEALNREMGIRDNTTAKPLKFFLVIRGPWEELNLDIKEEDRTTTSTVKVFGPRLDRKVVVEKVFQML